VALPTENGSRPGQGHPEPHPARPWNGEAQGELAPTGGGDPIPLIRPTLTVGRRDGCDVWLRFPEVSGQHCRLSFEGGFWYVEDLGSTNGTKVNGTRIGRKKFLSPGDTLQVAKCRFTVHYRPPAGVPFPKEEEDLDTVMGRSLLERAGLARPKRPSNGWTDQAPRDADARPGEGFRYD
jgi:adenylate cyclase